jgi:hypothetical protein
MKNLSTDQNKYWIQDINEAEGYYGSIDLEGNWIIRKVTATSVTYATGAENYPTNWTNRASLTYGYITAK